MNAKVNVVVAIVAKFEDSSLSVLSESDDPILNPLAIQGPFKTAAEGRCRQLRKRLVHYVPLFIFVLIR